MRIASKFRINTIFFVGMVCLIGIIEYGAFAEVNDAIQKSDMMDHIVKEAFGLNVITFDYLQESSKRASTQWSIKHDSIKKLMADIGFQNRSEQFIIEKIRLNHDDMKAIFPILNRTIENNDKNDEWLEKRKDRFATQLLIKSQNIISYAEKLNAISHEKLRETRKRKTWIVMSTVIIIALLITFNSYLIRIRIVRPIEKLHHEVEILGRGDLSHKIVIDSTDEIGKLSESFNRMVKNLKTLTVSRDKLTREIEERMQVEAEKKILEAKLRQQQKLESIGTLASGVAHEINNPVNGIMNYAQLIKDRLDPDNPLKEFAHEIIHETNRVTTIVYNLLTFARQEKYKPASAKISDIIENTLSLIKTVIRHDQIILTVKISDDLPQIMCLSQQIQQVLMNLMINARDSLNEKYSKYDENKKISISSHLLEKEEKKWIRTSVVDHGTGIPPEIRERIFDPFFTTKPREKGTGLGLSISYGIVQEHYGELHVESVPGTCTSFHMDLPVDKSNFSGS